MRPETIAALWREIEPLIGPVEATGCQRWQGAYTRYADRSPKAPSIYIDGSLHNPQRILLERAGVHLARYARVGVTCGDPLCMAPAHVGPRVVGDPPPSKVPKASRASAAAPAPAMPDPAEAPPAITPASAVQLVGPFRSGEVTAFTPWGILQGSALSVCAEVEARQRELQERERAKRAKAGAR